MLRLIVIASSFNPYFDGRAFGSIKNIRKLYKMKCFNPYFDGRAFGSFNIIRKAISNKCFNPYFDGRAFGSAVPLIFALSFNKFQSLFRWKSLWKFLKRCQRPSFYQVSILISMEEPLEALGVHHQRLFGAIVSILISMEEPLEVLTFPNTFASLLVSILISMEEPLEGYCTVEYVWGQY